MAESSGSTDRPTMSLPVPKASMLKMLKKSKMKQALRIRPGPEQVLLSAEALCKAFSQAKGDAASRGAYP